MDRFARFYTPTVVGAAVALTLLLPPLGLGACVEWFYRALVLLVVACPCALVISTPVTVASALAGAAQRSILIKGGLRLENAGRARVVERRSSRVVMPSTGMPASKSRISRGTAATAMLSTFDSRIGEP